MNTEHTKRASIGLPILAPFFGPGERRALNMEIQPLDTTVGLEYFRQVRDEVEGLTDRQLLELYELVRELEIHAKYPWNSGAFMRSAGWKKHAMAPFDALPCHRALMIEVQGREWVLERERDFEIKEIERKAKEEEEQIKMEAARKKKAANIKFLREL